jgi:RNA polymerase sigma-70 factor (ECF subfamily)
MMYPDMPRAMAESVIDTLEATLREALGGIVSRREESLAQFYDATVGRVYGLALRVTSRSDAAEEVTADVYMQVWNQAERFDQSRGSVLAWLLTICRSRAIDYLRRRDEAESWADPPEPEGSAGQDPQDLLVAMESGRAVSEALQILLPLQRQLVSLAFFRGLTHEEIAEHVQLPLGTVKTHIRKALASLRKHLAPRIREDAVRSP